ncbi:hypothetical protein HDU77_000139 [Chytriomyces hyalinus]|uniref:Uncharacterized protein n=1 Tax=Chytriomyces confervae TaxID=246404 RepID=A0A507FN98_9FUNG|nr:hypothetical protein HDU77_000139 [Chytriomyces hyalinus]TPX77742.1 hypothetical protein CcCBS67573_g00967 [Chytriomyces confervae]
MPSSSRLLTLPIELKRQILFELPIDDNLKSIALVCRSEWTQLVLGDIDAATAHLGQLRGDKCLWIHTQETRVYTYLNNLPLSYKCALYAATMRAPEWIGARGFVGDPYLSPMFYKRWKLAPELAMRIVRIWHSREGGFDFTVKKNRPLRWAARSGYVDVVRFLLNLPGVDPCDDDNYAIKCASETGQAEIVSILLLHGCDPSSESNMALQYACEFGHAEVVKILLADPRVDPSSEYFNAFGLACGQNHVPILELLLNDQTRPSMPVQVLNSSLVYAADHGCKDAAEYLLKHPYIDPSFNENEAVTMAAANGHVDVLQLLVLDPRVELTARNLTGAIAVASRNNHEKVLSVLLECLSRPKRVGFRQ